MCTGMPQWISRPLDGTSPASTPARVGLRAAFQQQASSELLLTRLASLAASPGDLPAVPALQLAVANVLKQIVDAPQLMTATGVANAVAQSGNFLEANSVP